MKKELEDKIGLLVDSITKLKNRNDVINFLDDLCTVSELEQMEQRIEAAKLLLNGATYEEVITKTKISSATLARVSKCIHNGNQGYKKVLEKEK